MKNVRVWMVAMMIVSVAGCQKEESVSPPQSEVSEPVFLSAGQSASDVDIVCTDIPKKGSQKSSSAVLGAMSYSAIPVGFYRLYAGYKDSYRHLKQPDAVSCSWTSYDIVVATLANYNSCGYPVSAAKVYAIRDACGGSKLITSLAWYGQNYDQDLVYTFQKSTSSRLDALRYLLYWIDTYHTPCVVISTIYTSSGSVLGHYRIVHSINWTGSESSSVVYYTDCNETPKVLCSTALQDNLRSMYLSDFLNLMKTSTSLYNMLFFAPLF